MSRKSIVDRKKGKSLLVIPRDYTLVDLETTGFSSLFDDIIEVGLIKIRDGKEIDRYQSLVKPSKPIPYIIECVTGIKNDMVANAPTFENIGKDVWSFLENEVIVGHNVSFDINFLYDNFERAFKLTFQNNFVDTLRLARRLIPDIKSQDHGNYGLDYLCNYFHLAYENRHRAIGDCLCTNNLLRCLSKIVTEKNINLIELEREIKCRNKGNISTTLKSLKSDGTVCDKSHMFFGKCCVFTGKLEFFTRVEAAQIVVNIGGYCENSVTKKTNFLIVGDMDYKAGLEGYESNKLKKAKKLIDENQELAIIPESAFYDLVDEYLDDE